MQNAYTATFILFDLKKIIDYVKKMGMYKREERIIKQKKVVLYSILLNMITLAINIWFILNDQTAYTILSTTINSVFNSGISARNKEMPELDKAIILSITIVNIIGIFIYLPLLINLR